MIRGLLRDYEPSCEPSFEALISNRVLVFAAIFELSESASAAPAQFTMEFVFKQSNRGHGNQKNIQDETIVNSRIFTVQGHGQKQFNWQ